MRSKLPNTPISIFSVMSKMAGEYEAINLSQGFPGFDIAPQLTALVNSYMKKGMNQYAPMPGVPALRESLTTKMNAAHGCALKADQNILITAGATQALYACITTIVDSGDEVIYFEPAYDSYKPAVVLNGGVPVGINLEAPTFNIPWDEVEKKTTGKTKLIIVNSPHNPTGALLDEQDMIRLQELIHDKNIYVLSDEVYEHIVFDKRRHESVLRFDELRKKSMAVYSFGKTFHATGWKVGYVVAPEEILDEVKKVHQFMVFSVNTPVQYALAEYLETPDNYNSLGPFFQEKRDSFLHLMSSSRFTPIPCSGTYFQTFSYDQISQESDMDMAERLTKEHGVASVPVSAFYSEGKDDHLLRFCFAKETDQLKKAADILCKI